MRLLNHFILFSILALIVYACATTEPAAEPEDDREVEGEPFAIFDFSDDLAATYLEELDLDDLNEEELALYQTRSHLSDRFGVDSHDMPDFYLEEFEEVEVDIYQGFRIQILSTRDVELADSTLAGFETWADTTFSGYLPRGYIHYRQPYYRVRIGDFQNREKATELSRMLKVRYPEAWVIHDRINPYRAPADTTEIRMNDVLNQIN